MFTDHIYYTGILAIKLYTKYDFFPGMHADLFSCHARPSEVYVFVAVANRGEDVMSDEIPRRFLQWKAEIKEAE